MVLGDPEPSLEDRVIALVEIHGADPALWPPTARTADALSLIAQPPVRLSKVMADEAALDGLLADVRRPEPSPELVASLMADAPKPKSSAFWAQIKERLRRSPVLAPVGGAAASLVFGLLLGVLSPYGGSTGDDADTDAMIYAALGIDDFSGAFEESGFE
ncbi:MAG: hypothetical protein AAFR94_05270 [Pseudomonadota bacterium]